MVLDASSNLSKTAAVVGGGGGGGLCVH